MVNLRRILDRGTLLQILVLTAAAVVVGAFGLWLGSCTGWLLPVAASAEAQAVDGLFRLELTLAAIVAGSVLALVLYMAIAFRRAGEDTSDGPNIQDNERLQQLWTLLPVVLVAFLTVYGYQVYRQLIVTTPLNFGHAHPLVAPEAQLSSGPAPIQIEVVAHQWGWTFFYPGHPAKSELHLPAGQQVNLTMRSEDVIHGFWIPAFRLKQDVIPGRTIPLNLRPLRVGRYVLECTQLCGLYHGAMRARVVVELPEDYERWLDSTPGASGR
ncbi:cytochrome c oxidase subunit II [Gloeobacter kilaueensis]|uniref:Cytochrome c oxidase subunit 2 n=1 Tax=Gloeobacter kilaueensis (strain ATCC BAA-2537 / CCAP 1431/1 / ULC 316 / JS1) TaxID=1183438 RepID=U5QJU6_GLOK1|nr:cytochrome c oxidase subunit II [Gloeobacter kilaueensis]AGY59262.1 cytochrome c oxidase subunit II [Gloeobacter kilaueensis JS1]